MAEEITTTTTPTPPHVFQIGDRVERIEDRVEVSATVISINVSSSGPDGENVQSVEISYDEGGSGWWPSTCLRPLVLA